MQRFERWAETVPVAIRSGEWECDYPEWASLLSAFSRFLSKTEIDRWSARDVADVLYAIARDNEGMSLARELATRPHRLLAAAAAAVESDECDAKWQIAAALGDLTGHKPQAEELLLKLVADRDEYVRRRSLLALAALGSPHSEALAIEAWNSGLEYPRIAALWVLHSVRSPRLAEYLKLAIADGREYVVRNAKQIEGAGRGAPA